MVTTLSDVVKDLLRQGRRHEALDVYRQEGATDWDLYTLDRADCVARGRGIPLEDALAELATMSRARAAHAARVGVKLKVAAGCSVAAALCAALDLGWNKADLGTGVLLVLVVATPAMSCAATWAAQRAGRRQTTIVLGVLGSILGFLWAGLAFLLFWLFSVINSCDARVAECWFGHVGGDAMAVTLVVTLLLLCAGVMAVSATRTEYASG